MPILKGILQGEGALTDVQFGWSTNQARALRHLQRPVPPRVDVRALLDTGAEITCIDGIVVQQLGLPLAQVALANIPMLGGLSAGAHYHASLIVVHPSGDPSQSGPSESAYPGSSSRWHRLPGVAWPGCT